MQRKQASASYHRPTTAPARQRRLQPLRPPAPDKSRHSGTTPPAAPSHLPNGSAINDEIDNLLASTGIAIVYVDRQLRILRFTSLATQLIQMDITTAGQRLTELTLNLPGYASLAADTQQVLMSRQALERQVQSSHGRWFTLRIRPYRTLDKSLVGAVLTFVDITKAHLAQEALRDSERLLRESQSVVGIGSYITDLATGNWKVSPEMYKIFGIDENYPHTLAGWAAFLHPDTREQLFQYHLKVEREQLRFDCQYKIIRINDGAVRWVHGLGELEYDENGKPVRRIGTIQDVTERKQAEEELNIAAVAFEAHNCMVITDEQGIILRVNTAFTHATGYSIEQAVGKKPGDLLKSGRHDALFYQRMWEDLLTKGRWQGEIWNRHKNQHVYAELLTITAVIGRGNSVTHYVGSYSDIRDDKEAQAEIHRLAYYDPLTHLPNRRLLQDRLGQALVAANRSGRFGALFFIDLDNFKSLNDTRGHDAGDLLLVEVAQRLRAVVREGDTVARQGGDEFVVLLENLSQDEQDATEQAAYLAEKLRAETDKPFSLNGQEYRCKLSIGVGLFNQYDTVENLFKHADLALYQAKNAGRNTLRFFDPALLAELEQRSKLEAELHQSLTSQQLLLQYQPQVNHLGAVIGVEALLRWQHPQRGLVMPNDFIPLAEETGWILLMGLWALEHACSQLQAWANNPLTQALQIAVNVSPRQFRQSDFVHQVQQALSNSGANPARLKLELTESLVLEDVEDTIAKMHAIRKLGVKFAMDDFGTGYSSLAYLAQLPLDQLKIDRTFVHNLPGRRNDETIARTIITMGQGLEIEVIAEGVETEAQFQFLQQHGCFAYQGYHFSRPLTLQALEAFLQQAPQHQP